MQEMALFLPPCRSDITNEYEGDARDSNALDRRSTVDDLSNDPVALDVMYGQDFCDCKVSGKFAAEETVEGPLPISYRKKEKRWVCCKCGNNYGCKEKDSCACFHEIYQPQTCESCPICEFDYSVVDERDLLLEGSSLAVIYSQAGDVKDLSSIPDTLEYKRPEDLQLLIRRSLLAAAGSPNSFFLPLGELENMINLLNLERELRRSGLTSDVEQIARQAWCPRKLPTGEFTTRRRIFAILCLMDMAAELHDFIAEEILDSDLPFDIEETRVFRRSGASVELFMQWKIYNRDIFRNYQGRFLAP
jgi:hypothetical protein